jgi:hypothetical protein
MQSALNMLGFGPCHHMFEVMAHPESMALWIDAGAGKPDWNAVFANYRSAVDYPTAACWRELADFYPNAKIVHTVRDPEKWFESTQATIFAAGGLPAQAMFTEGPLPDFFRSFIGDIAKHLNDRAFLLDHFRRHTEAVVATIPPERLLVHQTGDGWEPLCNFLGVPVPAEPYPSENSR